MHGTEARQATNAAGVRYDAARRGPGRRGGAAAVDARALASWLVERCRAQRTAAVSHRDAQRLGPVRDGVRLAAALEVLGRSGFASQYREGRRSLIKINAVIVQELATVATVATVAEVEASSVAAPSVASLDGPAALAIVKASKARMPMHHGSRVIAVAPANDTPELRQALAVLGYGACAVVHVDVELHAGRGAEVIAASVADSTAAAAVDNSRGINEGEGAGRISSE